MEHAQASGSIPCGSRQARAGDLGTTARKGTTRGHRQRLRWMRAFQEEHDVCPFFHGVNLLKAGSWTHGTRSLSAALGVRLQGGSILRIDFGEDVWQCVLGTVNSSAKSVMERSGAGRIGHLHCTRPWFQERVDSGEMRTEK